MTPLNFREVTTSDQNIEIKFAAGDHGDGSRNAFDGPGTVHVLGGQGDPREADEFPGNRQVTFVQGYGIFMLGVY